MYKAVVVNNTHLASGIIYTKKCLKYYADDQDQLTI